MMNLLKNKFSRQLVQFVGHPGANWFRLRTHNLSTRLWLNLNFVNITWFGFECEIRMKLYASHLLQSYTLVLLASERF